MVKSILILLKFLTLKWNISRTIWRIEVGDGSLFCIFHALSFELNFFRPEVPFKNFNFAEIAVVSLFSNNTQYNIKRPCTIMDKISDSKKLIPSKTYAGRELLSVLEGMVERNQFEADDQVTKTNKLKGITEITLNLDELDNTDNL